jgi:hypothetical protein
MESNVVLMGGRFSPEGATFFGGVQIKSNGVISAATQKEVDE